MSELPFGEERGAFAPYDDVADDVTTPQRVLATPDWAAVTSHSGCEAVSTRPPPPDSEETNSRSKPRSRRTAIGATLVLASAFGGVVLARDTIARELGVDPVAFMARTGSLRINVSHPAGTPVDNVSVFIDGRRVCDTQPCVINDAPTGPKTIKVVALDGASVINSQTELGAGRNARVDLAIPAEDLRQGIRFQSAQPGLRVQVDNELRDAGQLISLEAGQHVVRLEADHYRAIEHTVVVAPGQVLPLGPVMLQIHKVRLQIDVEPAASAVQLYAGKQKLESWRGAKILEVTAGDYRIVAASAGRRTLAKPLKITTTRDWQRVLLVLPPAPARSRSNVFEFTEEPHM